MLCNKIANNRSLGATSGISDLTEGSHLIRIKYDPNFDDSAGYFYVLLIPQLSYSFCEYLCTSS